MKYRRTFTVLTLLIAAGLLQGCGRPSKSEGGAGAASGKIEVVATLFPLYDFARQIGGDRISVSLLVPPGVEPHSFDPRPQDVIKVSRAKVFMYTGEHMEPWVDGFLGGVRNPSLAVVDTSRGVDMHEDHDDEDHDEDKEHQADAGGKDPHIWLDPLNAKIMVDTIAAALIKASPENAAYFESKARAYAERLEALHRKIAGEVAGFRTRTILYAGHFAFGYFAKRYGLDHVSPYEGFSPNAEPTPGRIVELTKKLRELGLSHVFHEELVDPRIAEVIAKETGARLLLLHGAHNISRDELERGVTYLEIMERNLANLKLALE